MNAGTAAVDKIAHLLVEPVTNIVEKALIINNSTIRANPLNDPLEIILLRLATITVPILLFLNMLIKHRKI